MKIIKRLFVISILLNSLVNSVSASEDDKESSWNWEPKTENGDSEVQEI